MKRGIPGQAHAGPSRQDGFTLVEMAVVLAIIGLIIGAVMIGMDVQRNAEYTKVKQKFIDQWVVAYNAYYQRTGVAVADDQIQPQLMVNGQSFVSDGNTSGGDMTGEDPLAAVCQGDNDQLDDLGIDVDDEMDLRTLMLQAGVSMPQGRAEGFEDRYVYLDTNGNPQEIQVCFQWNPPGTASGSGNVMIITGLTPDLARYLDQAIDGQADAREGVFRQVGVDNDSDNQPGLEWDLDNTFAIGDQPGDPGEGPALDEDQVAIVAAHYQMNQ